MTNKEYIDKWLSTIPPGPMSNRQYVESLRISELYDRPNEVFVGPIHDTEDDAYVGYHRGELNTFECPCGMCRYKGRHRI